MKRHILTLATALTALAVLAPALPGLAAPLDRKDVAADPAMLFHVDLDAVRLSAVGQAILNEPETQDKLASLSALIDFDLRKQLHGFTVYTTMDHPRDGVLIVYADFDPERLITLAKGAENFESVTNGAHVIYSWQDDRRKGRGSATAQVYGAMLGHRVIFGQNSDRLAAALEVMDSNAPSFSGNSALPDAEAGETALVQGVVLKFDADRSGQRASRPGARNRGSNSDASRPGAAIFKMTKSLRLQVSETGKNLNVAVHFEAADTNTATQIAAIAQGLLAMAKMQQDDANAVKLANAAVIKQDGAMVGLTITEPSSTMIDMIKDGQAKAARRPQRENRPPDDKPGTNVHNHPNNFQDN